MSKSKQALKNSLYMYLRTGLQTIITLFSVRILLSNLGVVDFGLYNTIGSIVVLCAFVTSALSSSTQRFISFELGRNDEEGLSNVYYESVKLHKYLSLIIAAICEVIGLVFIFNYMNVDPERKWEMTLVLQLSIACFVYNIIIVPFRAVLTAYERFDWISILTIVEAVLKLTIAYLVGFFCYNRLVIYAILFLLITIMVFYSYRASSGRYTRNFIRYSTLGKKQLKNMLTFSGWNFLGGLGQVLMNQFSNMIINVFCGPIVNAAQSIATQVNSYVNKFTQDFISSIQPQIVKSFASKDNAYLDKVVFSGLKISYFLIVGVSVPLAFNIDFVLRLWLGDYPSFVPVFIRLLLVNSAVVAATGTISTLIESNGNIKWTQISYTIVMVLCTIISFAKLYLTHNPVWVYYSMIMSSVLCLFIRVYISCRFKLMNLVQYLKVVTLYLAPYTICYLLLFYALKKYIVISEPYFALVSLVFSIIFIPIYGYTVFLNNVERDFLKRIALSKISVNK